MNSFEENLEKYAALAVEIGVNLQKGQPLFISAPIHALDFVQKVTKKAYEVGASDVQYDWTDDSLTRMKFNIAPDETFKSFPQWKARGREEMAEKNTAFLSITASDPDLLKGVDPERIANATKSSGEAMKTFRKYIMSDKISWSIVAIPSIAWADKVFPDLDKEERIDALWEAIFAATRADQDDPVTAWKEHVAILDEKAKYLNDEHFHALHYTAPGTDLTVELPEKHIWVSAGSHNEQGTLFIANMPTEEVFTTPVQKGVNGIVTNTKPLSYSGNLIDNFKLTFKEGKIVDFEAETGYEALKRLIETDEGSHYLGEMALVPDDSPISNSGHIFFNTLFDENASNHLAIGSSYSFCIEGGKTMDTDQLAKEGLNDSITHVDFMIGSKDMNIDGITQDGEKKPLFREGNWAF